MEEVWKRVCKLRSTQKKNLLGENFPKYQNFSSFGAVDAMHKIGLSKERFNPTLPGLEKST